MKNKGQVGTTITWSVAFVAIVLILTFFILITLSLVTQKKIDDLTLINKDKSNNYFSVNEYYSAIFLINFLSYQKNHVTIYDLFFDYYNDEIDKIDLKKIINEFFIGAGYKENEIGYAIDLEEKRFDNSDWKSLDSEFVYQRMEDFLIFGKKESIDRENNLIEIGIYLEDLNKDD